MALYDQRMKDVGGETVDLAEYRGKVLLIVNSATN